MRRRRRRRQVHVHRAVAPAAPPPPPPPTQPQVRERLFGGVVAWVLFVLVLGGGFGCAAAAVEGWRLEQRFAREGRRAEGLIVAKWTRPGHKRTLHHVGYEFADAAGSRRFRACVVGRATYHTLSVGQPRAVEYLPTDPAWNRLPLDRGDTAAWHTPTFFAALLLGGGGGWLFVQRASARWRARLVCTGVPRPGRVLACEVRKREGIVMTYEYVDLTGGHRIGSDYIPSGEVARWPANAAITVVVDPRDERQSEPDLWFVHGAARPIHTDADRRQAPADDRAAGQSKRRGRKHQAP